MKRDEALNLLNFKEKRNYEKLSNEAIALKLKYSYGVDEELEDE